MKIERCPECGHGMDWHIERHGCTHADERDEAPNYSTCPCTLTGHLVDDPA
jgi:ssDNA-binding Zn-finger/Zn-ribbon topoisomerase 1